jgi:predicted DNA-binding antitoxin AbrB/MazE fold protein
VSYRIDAIFEDGVFRPDVPIAIPNGERVTLRIEPKGISTEDLSDVMDLLDTEFLESCRRHDESAPSLEEVRNILSAFQSPLADYIVAERDER